MTEPTDDGHHHVWEPVLVAEEEHPVAWVCSRCQMRVDQAEMPPM